MTKTRPKHIFCWHVTVYFQQIKAYDLADAEGEWNILHHARWGGFDAPLNCARHQPGGRDGGLRQEPLTDVSQTFIYFYAI